jgi:hypothetical protein
MKYISSSAVILLTVVSSFLSLGASAEPTTVSSSDASSRTSSATSQKGIEIGVAYTGVSAYSGTYQFSDSFGYNSTTNFSSGGPTGLFNGHAGFQYLPARGIGFYGGGFYEASSGGPLVFDITGLDLNLEYAATNYLAIYAGANGSIIVGGLSSTQTASPMVGGQGGLLIRPWQSLNFNVGYRVEGLSYKTVVPYASTTTLGYIGGLQAGAAYVF